MVPADADPVVSIRLQPLRRVNSMAVKIMAITYRVLSVMGLARRAYIKKWLVAYDGYTG
jgi:UV DNA damage repair endonuclease